MLEEGKQRACLQPDEPGVSCHGALGKPFTDLAGSGDLRRPEHSHTHELRMGLHLG